MEVSTPGSFALVSYVPEPLGSFIDGFRTTLPGSDPAQAHVTILPPRPLRVTLQQASNHALAMLSRFKPFEIELAGVNRFPLTNFLYLEVGSGNNTVRELHKVLNTDTLADSEQFEFQPHLTLGGPIPEGMLLSAEAQAVRSWEASELPRRFVVEEVVALWSPPQTGLQDVWSRVWVYELGRAQVRYHASVATGQTS